MSDDPLNLRSLPSVSPPEALWDAIAVQLERPTPVELSPEPEEPGHPWMPLAVAASIVVISLLLALLRPTLPETIPAESEHLRRLRSVSAALEDQLDAYHSGVFNATTADAIARRQRELAWLDVQLGSTPDDATLWAERVVLLSEMLERYMASDWRSQMDLASY